MPGGALSKLHDHCTSQMARAEGRCRLANVRYLRALRLRYFSCENSVLPAKVAEPAVTAARISAPLAPAALSACQMTLTRCKSSFDRMWACVEVALVGVCGLVDSTLLWTSAAHFRSRTESGHCSCNIAHYTKAATSMSSCCSAWLATPRSTRVALFRRVPEFSLHSSAPSLHMAWSAP